MSDTRPIASVSLDLDDLWTYMRTRGDPAWRERPSYLPVFVPRCLDELERLALRITVFVVGFDAARPANGPHLRDIAERGHEIANHSFSHECWMHLHGHDRLVAEVARAEEALVSVTGRKPVGFRGPGFSWSPALLEVLADRGYRYDASTLPTFLGPMARLYFLAKADLTKVERERRGQLFGSAREGLRPSGAYNWRLQNGRTLLEIPTTTIPVVKIPFHMSYLIYLRQYSKHLMLRYLRTALSLCRMARIEPSFLLHPLDLLSDAEVPQLAFFPGMSLPGPQKRETFAEVLRVLGEQFEIVTMGEHAERLLTRKKLRLYAASPRQRAVPGSNLEIPYDVQYDPRGDHVQAS